MRLARLNPREMLQMVKHDFAAESMALDTEKPGGVRLIAAGYFEDASN